ncbi:DUF2493 domain-containing protein [bacterium]|nr:DUF2493 domain-containing protein [bacterium]
MRVLITGGRNFDNRELLEATLDAVHTSATLSVLIHGAANGLLETASKLSPVLPIGSDMVEERGQ